jgi:glycosyltransferase involved in cell wall biosynthesis
MSNTRPKILVVIDWYLPGYRGGGPITSIANLVAGLSHAYDWSIITSDRDYGQKSAYADIKTNEWIALEGNNRVWYCSPDEASYRHFRRLIAETSYDLLYLNSMFSMRYTLYPLWNSRSIKPEVPVLLAPRGMLQAGALSLKPRKKKIFLRFLRLMGIDQQISFQATDAQEASDIEAVFGPKTRIVQAANLPRIQQNSFQSIPKVPGQLKMVFLSRLTAKKGLHSLLEYLQAQTSQISLDIIGPDEEPGYWARCAALIAQLPSNIQVQKMDSMPPDRAMAQLQAAHVFVMPTWGENFGHAIFEAFGAGRPVLISDQTPWRQLAARKLGFDLPLSDTPAFLAAIQQFAEMDQATWEEWARAAHAFAQEFAADKALLADNMQMIESTLASELGKPKK